MKVIYDLNNLNESAKLEQREGKYEAIKKQKKFKLL